MDSFQNLQSSCWQVVGGSGVGGILVRQGFDLQSPLCRERLATGALVRQIKVSGGRVHYTLLSGAGPPEGWVSIRNASKDLLVSVKAPVSRQSRKYLSEFTSRERQAIQMDLLAEYSKYDFQEELHRVWEAANGDASKQAKMRWAVCWSIQAPISKQHGFAGSTSDLLQSNACIAVEDARAEVEEELVYGAWLMWLIHPPAQVVHPNGPPRSVSAAEMLQASVPGLATQLPKHKVLAQVPCSHIAQHTMYLVRVVGAMSGNLLCTVEVAASDRVCDLRRFICKLEGTPTTEQKLLLDGKLLQCDIDDIASLFQQQNAKSRTAQTASTESAAPHCLTLTLVRLSSERAALLKDIEHGVLSLDGARTELREDPECVLAAVKRNPASLIYAPEDLQNDRAFMLVASKRNGGILQYAADWVRKARDIVLAAVQLDPQMLKFASDELQGDYEIVRAAVESGGMALQFASDALRGNPNIVRAAVANAGSSLRYVSDALKSDQRIVLAALTQDVEGAARHVGPELLQDFSFAATLQDLGFLNDFLFNRIFPESYEVARNYFGGGEAVVLVVGPEHGDLTEHAVDRAGPLRVPMSLVKGVHWSFENLERFSELLSSAQNPLLIYNDYGYPSSSAAKLQYALRMALKSRNMDMIHLVVDGLSRWQLLGYPLKGITSKYLQEAPKPTLRMAQHWNPIG